MLERMAIVVLLAAATSGLAMAQTPPQSTPVVPGPPPISAQSSDECLRRAMSLAEEAEDKQLAEDRLERIDDLLLKMETHCDARQFGDAAAVALDIRAAIDGR